MTPTRTHSPEIDETPRPGELPKALVLRLAEAKARTVPRADGEVVLAGDTVVAVGRRILGQVADPQQQSAFLTLLSGRRHQVLSAVAVVGGDGQLRVKLSTTTVRVKRLHADEIAAYVQCGEGLGKAGGYAIQGRFEALVEQLCGSHSGVMGLPLRETRLLLKGAGLPLD